MTKARVLSLAAATALIMGLDSTPAEAHSLTYREAMRAAQARADAYAQQPTRITVRLRGSPHAYYVQVEWITIDPQGCKGCGVHDPATNTPAPVIHELVLWVVCAGRHSVTSRGQACPGRAYVTRVLA